MTNHQYLIKMKHWDENKSLYIIGKEQWETEQVYRDLLKAITVDPTYKSVFEFIENYIDESVQAGTWDRKPRIYNGSEIVNVLLDSDDPEDRAVISTDMFGTATVHIVRLIVDTILTVN